MRPICCFDNWPNPAVKGTRRPKAVLKVGFLYRVRQLRLASLSGPRPVSSALGNVFLLVSSNPLDYTGGYVDHCH
jgi:hypothetical protein